MLNKHLLRTMFILGCFAIMPSISFAKENPGTTINKNTQIVPYVGVDAIMGMPRDADVEDSASFSINTGVKFYQKIGLELSLGHTFNRSKEEGSHTSSGNSGNIPHDVTLSKIDAEANFLGININTYLKINEHHSVVPTIGYTRYFVWANSNTSHETYLTFNGNKINEVTTAQRNSSKYTISGINLGLGYQYELSDSIDVITSFNYVHFMDKAEKELIWYKKDELNFKLGLKYKFNM